MKLLNRYDGGSSVHTTGTDTPIKTTSRAFSDIGSSIDLLILQFFLCVRSCLICGQSLAHRSRSDRLKNHLRHSLDQSYLHLTCLHQYISEDFALCSFSMASSRIVWLEGNRLKHYWTVSTMSEFSLSDRPRWQFSFSTALKHDRVLTNLLFFMKDLLQRVEKACTVPVQRGSHGCVREDNLSTDKYKKRWCRMLNSSAASLFIF